MQYMECRAWDWNGRICYVKDNGESKAIQGGRWSGRLGPRDDSKVPPQSQLSFDDSKWEIVDAPHDMGRSSATNDRQGHCLKGGRRLQDLAEPEMHNNCTGWYRKVWLGLASGSGLGLRVSGQHCNCENVFIHTHATNACCSIFHCLQSGKPTAE